MLYILDYNEALVFKSTDHVILGRNAPGGHATPGDLTRYGGYSMGVSRQHAEICCTEQGYTIQDLGSANGTWINEKRLPPRHPAPLKHGDMLWLGQLIVMIYLSKD
ncbi:MAG TPA: FHA domain-containing protein [Aggregatilineaceae bacterium]|nr:FHA domain-containing protein [Aggregatilineaceae bacterium]